MKEENKITISTESSLSMSDTAENLERFLEELRAEWEATI